MALKDKKKIVYCTKNAGEAAVTDLDSGSRRVKMVLSRFDVVDSDGDVLREGTFAKSIQERGVSSSSNRKIAHLRQHKWDKQIGKFVELYEEGVSGENGLVAVSELGRSTIGEDAFLDYQDGIIREHSIGFRYEKLDFIPVESKEGDGQELAETIDMYGGYWNVTEVNLFEGSAVTFGANEHTPVLNVSKSKEEHETYLATLNSQIDNIQKVLRNGKGTDDRFFKLEMKLATYQQEINDYINSLLANQKPLKSKSTQDAQTEPKRVGLEFLKALK